MGTYSGDSVENYASQVKRVLIVTLILNSLVAGAKISYGYITDSIAMTSDGFHSFFDGVSNLIGLLGIWIASHPPDDVHPYGHKKFETLFTIIIAGMIFATSFQILRRAYFSMTGDYKTVVTGVSFFLMTFTVLINYFVMAYETKKGRELRSDFLIADSMHTKSDILVSFMVLVSLVLTKNGYRYADTIVAIVITVFIARIGYRIVKNASRVLVDSVCIDTGTIAQVVNTVEGVKGCHDIRTRGPQNAVYLDLHVLVDNTMPTETAHQVADIVEERIKQEFPAVTDIVVHIEPEKVNTEEKDR